VAVQLRRYEWQDGDAVRDLHRRALATSDADLGPGPWDDDLADVQRVYLDSGGDFVVAVDDGRVLGMGAFRPVDTVVAEIKRMRVDPDHQRRGIGRAILGDLERRARAAGFRRLVLDTTTNQTAALSLYRSAGYRETGRGVVAGSTWSSWRRGSEKCRKPLHV
jgi:ribosomal protein S18 acetylase RimI-like enzyme